METHSGIILVASLYYLYAFAEGQTTHRGVDDTILPLCSRMCNPSKEFSKDIPFPYRCSCSQSCAVFGDCCHDSPYKSELKTFDFIRVLVDGLGEFRAVSSCPRNQRSDSCKTFLGDLPPVTSRITNTSYGNIHCASCNNDGNNLITWNVELRCSSRNDTLDDSLDFSETVYYDDKFWRQDKKKTWRTCKFYVQDKNFTLLNNLELRPCDSARMVSSCSPSWRDLSVEQKCRSYEDPIYTGDTLFRNSHCAQCNFMELRNVECIPSYLKEMLESGKNDEVVRSCMYKSRNECIRDVGRGPRYSLSKVFPDIGTQLQEFECLSPPKTCPKGEKYDKSTCQCRRVITTR